MRGTPKWLMDEALRRESREDKLPLWVQDKLNALRQALTQQATLATEAVAGTDPAGSDTVLEPFAPHGGIGLGQSPTVQFRTPGGGCIDVAVRGDEVYITGGESLAVYPRTWNSMVVRDRRSEP